LNENGTMDDFRKIDELLTRLAVSIEPENKTLFNRKNTYIFVAAFKAFTESGKEDTEFNGFLQWFINDGKNTEIDGKTWDSLDITRSTKDSSVVHGKVDYLVALMEKYFKEIRKVA